MILNDDFRDFIKALNKNEVEYVLIGGYAVILHGYSRNTGDLDIWVKKNKDNYLRLVNAFHDFGMPLFHMSEDNFLNNPEIDVFTFGLPPVSIDLMTQAKGLDFNETFANARLETVEGLQIRLIHIKDLIKGKKVVNRPKDQNDIDHLKSLKAKKDQSND